MRIKEVLTLLKATKKKRTFGMHFSTHDPLLWFLWRQVQELERKKHGSQKVSYLIVKKGVVDGVKKYYPELYLDFKRTFFKDDKEFDRWRRSKYSKISDLISTNIELVRLKIRKMGIKRGGLDAFVRQVEEKEE